ncbi:MAG: hypothetical protein JWN47_534 [Frankiales bacterium]|nr:hypothetical protein [Frankiales bacterium]
MDKGCRRVTASLSPARVSEVVLVPDMPLRARLATATAWRLALYEWMATVSSTSTGAPDGRLATPTADRATWPRSPSSS